jgi:hypothetical protein
MKRLLLIAALTAGAVSCVEGNRAIQILESREVGVDCEPGNPLLVGSLNYDVTNIYLANFTLFSPIQQGDDSPNRLDFFGREIVLNYESQNPPITFNEEIRPVYLVVGAGSEDATVTLNLIGDKARAKLEGVVPTSPEAMTLLVSLRIRGELSSGTAVETNEVTFPIQISRAGPACPAGQVLTVQEGACFNPGQSGQKPTCQTAPP